MNRQNESYYKRDREDNAPYLDDLLCGKLRIYDVPPEYRLIDAYIYAIRWARDYCDKQYAYTEKKLIEHFLLSDIIETYRTGDPRYEQIYGLYNSYFHPEGVNIFNGISIGWEDYKAAGFVESEDGTRFSFDMKGY